MQRNREATHVSNYDAAVIGGSYAGIAAALQLARARKRVVVLDTGERRNRFASEAHGLLGFDGASPSSIWETARNQLRRYPTVTWLAERATSATGSAPDFELSTSSGLELTAKRIVLAMGIRDELPSVPGITERWGTSVFHCPYCHGYEVPGRRIGVLATSPMSLHQAKLLTDWGDVTLLSSVTADLPVAELDSLRGDGVLVEPRRVIRVEGKANVVLEGGTDLEFDGLFVAPRSLVPEALLRGLGCRIGTHALGSFVETNQQNETTSSGVFACGDLINPGGNIALAVGSGTLAGVAAHRSLLFG